MTEWWDENERLTLALLYFFVWSISIFLLLLFQNTHDPSIVYHIVNRVYHPTLMNQDKTHFCSHSMLAFLYPKVSHHPQHPEWADPCQLPHPVCVCVCASEHIQHMCESFLMHAPHTSTTDHLGLSSHRFIRLSLWCERPRSPTDAVLGNETEWICALHTKEEACHWSVASFESPLSSVHFLQSLAHTPPKPRQPP